MLTHCFFAWMYQWNLKNTGILPTEMSKGLNIKAFQWLADEMLLKWCKNCFDYFNFFTAFICHTENEDTLIMLPDG